MNDTTTLDDALSALGSDSAEARLHARATLVARGEAVTAQLLTLLDEPAPVGVEALRVLSSTADHAALDALHARLSHEDPEVRWLAAEGLAKLGLPAIERVLHDLTDADLPEPVRRAAHHVLGAQRGRALRTLLIPVLTAYQGDIERLEVARAAFVVLDALRSTR